MTRNKFKILILIVSAYVVALFPTSVLASALQRSSVAVSPPLITLVPRNLGNDEIWYIGGTSVYPDAEIIIYLQNNDGEIYNFSEQSNEKGEWFHTHNGFLKEGNYKSWAQVKIGETISPPSPEMSFEIAHTALRIGALRISNEYLYLSIALILLAVLLGGIVITVLNFQNYRKKHSQLMKEIQEAEWEVAKGFKDLKHEIHGELDRLSKIKLLRELDSEENRIEAKLLSDLDLIESHILKEISEIEPTLS